ncbi:predicted protein [Sparassis crispa]|uniref:Protein rds1 n=1 Tax=Sparassis crispa TaxID=139825 RepID=A0A401GMB3_9APHY|nr:predicted protein [Sparassis crispa]GBE83320.1 predicted protein [Sparassis crispa]
MFSPLPLLLAAFSSAVIVGAAPTFPPASVVNDTNIMNYALTLEYIERTFYEQGLEQFCEDDFEAAGFPPWVRGRFVQIRDHEETHVQFLTSQLDALGATPVEPCNYSYPYTDVQSWVALSMTLESVGSGAYMGAGRFISDKDTLVASQSIAQIEARQAGWVASAAKHLQPWDGDFETPLYFSGAFSLAVGFIDACPASNPPIPVTVFPPLSVSNSTPAHGDTIALAYNASVPAGNTTFLAWYSGLSTTFTPIANGTTTVPDALLGTVYAGVVANQSAQTGDATMLTGLAVFNFPFNSSARGNA